MNNALHIVMTSVVQALQELRANKLRTSLSLLGITIGIFCIIAVRSAFDSAQHQIQKNVDALGSDVLYVGRWPWPGMEEGEFKWWEYWRRPSLTNAEVTAINAEMRAMCIATLSLPVPNVTVKHDEQELSSLHAYAVNVDFDKVQNIELAQGRYLADGELEGGSNVVVLGSDVCDGLFSKGVSPLGKTITALGRKYTVVGVMKKVGQGMTDFDFDNGILVPYYSITSVVDVRALEYNPRLIVKAYNPANVMEVKDEITGIIRRQHKLKPEQASDFTVNQLSGISKLLNEMFDRINIVGLFIGMFSLLVGAFGIANIMFVTVKERTKIIGLKKAIGARRSSILTEFLLEAIVLCLMGGLIGILIVLGLSVLISHLADMEVVLSFKNFVIGILVSAVTGVLSGYIPARKASKMDPVVAIRTN
jgi:putative ABC transport system permease protein